MSKYTGIKSVVATAIVEAVNKTSAYDYTTEVKEHGTIANGKTTVTVQYMNGAKYLPLPTVTVENGYEFKGWNVVVSRENKENAFTVASDEKRIDVSKYDDIKMVKAVAIIGKKTDDKNDNSISSSSSSNNSTSSSSSSSNKTITATSEQKVVKAAAAPANTTKVLPKTGASNVAPLLGGSLAVVALLMGYGVYSLVLRKKD